MIIIIIVFWGITRPLSILRDTPNRPLSIPWNKAPGEIAGYLPRHLEGENAPWKNSQWIPVEGPCQTTKLGTFRTQRWPTWPGSVFWYLCPLPLMVPKSQTTSGWDGAKTLWIMGWINDRSLNWFSRRISGCHQQYLTESLMVLTSRFSFAACSRKGVNHTPFWFANLEDDLLARK